MTNDEHSSSGQNETFSGEKPNDIFNKEIKVDIPFFSNKHFLALTSLCWTCYLANNVNHLVYREHAR